MMEMKTPAMRFLKMTAPSAAAAKVGTTTAMTKPTHWLWNGIHRNEVLVMQHRSGLAPGSAFQNMKSGIGVSEPCCIDVFDASFSDIAIK